MQIAAASTALILGHERRIDGAWDNPGGRGKKREKFFSGLEDSSGRKALAQAGIVLDVLGVEVLEAIRDGEAKLNAVYEQARLKTVNNQAKQ